MIGRSWRGSGGLMCVFLFFVNAYLLFGIFYFCFWFSIALSLSFTGRKRRGEGKRGNWDWQFKMREGRTEALKSWSS